MAFLCITANTMTTSFYFLVRMNPVLGLLGLKGLQEMRISVFHHTMSGPGYGFKDSATTPQGRDENNQFDLPEQDSPMSLNDWMDDQNEHHGSVIQDKAAQIHKDFTANSHELACASPEIEGAIQSHQNGDVEIGVRDIGWHKSTVEIPDPLIGTIPNGELFSMIRRFNKVRCRFQIPEQLLTEPCRMSLRLDPFPYLRNWT